MYVSRPILLHQVADLVILARIRATKAFFSLAHHARIWICNVTRGQLHLLLLEFVERFHRALLSICQRHFIALQQPITETVFPPAIWRRWQVIALVALILLEEFLLVHRGPLRRLLLGYVFEGVRSLSLLAIKSFQLRADIQFTLFFQKLFYVLLLYCFFTELILGLSLPCHGCVSTSFHVVDIFVLSLIGRTCDFLIGRFRQGDQSRYGNGSGSGGRLPERSPLFLLLFQLCDGLRARIRRSKHLKRPNILTVFPTSEESFLLLAWANEPRFFDRLLRHYLQLRKVHQAVLPVLAPRSAPAFLVPLLLRLQIRHLLSQVWNSLPLLHLIGSEHVRAG